MKKEFKKYWKKFWHFYWEDKSIASYVFFFIITYVVLKYLFFPGFLLATGLSDVTAVMTESMVHTKNIDDTYYAWMEDKGFTQEQLEEFPFNEGLYVGDVVFVDRVESIDEVNVGDVVVFYGPNGYSIIHRVVNMTDNKITTKGDANPRSAYYETSIFYSDVKGKAILSVPFLGYPRVFLGKLGV